MDLNFKRDLKGVLGMTASGKAITWEAASIIGWSIPMRLRTRTANGLGVPGVLDNFILHHRLSCPAQLGLRRRRRFRGERVDIEGNACI